jgi:hypothetical protein
MTLPLRDLVSAVARILGHMGRRAVAAAIVALVAAVPALAKGGAPFDRHAVHVSDTISVGVTEAGAAWPVRAVPVDVYLVPLAASSRWWSVYNTTGPTYGARPRLAAAVYLGRVWHLGRQTPRLRARVPRVAPGRYVLAYWVGAIRARWTSALPNFRVGTNSVLLVRR